MTSQTAPTASIKITPAITFLASGSDISNPAADSGYDTGLTAELDRIGTGGKGYRKITLTRSGFESLAEWLDCMAVAVADGDSAALARSCRVHADAARQRIAKLDAQAAEAPADSEYVKALAAETDGIKDAQTTVTMDGVTLAVPATGETARERKNRLARERRAAKKAA